MVSTVYHKPGHKRIEVMRRFKLTQATFEANQCYLCRNRREFFQFLRDALKQHINNSLEILTVSVA
jgi:hypothetical protein